MPSSGIGLATLPLTSNTGWDAALTIRKYRARLRRIKAMNFNAVSVFI